MAGAHRKPTRARKLIPLATCGIVATIAVLVWMTLRPEPQEKPVAGADSLPAPAAGAAPAPADTPSTDPPHPDGLPPDQEPAVPAAAVERAPAAARKAVIHPPPPPPPILCSPVLSGARPQVAQVGNHIGQTFGVADIGGAAGRADGDHGAGLALDFMIADAAQGDAIADFVLANQQRFGVTYLIWQQQYNSGGGWSYMEDRGGPTANHYDHVHVSFDPAAQVSVTC